MGLCAFVIVASACYSPGAMKKLPLETKDAAKLLDVSVGRVRQLEDAGILRANRTASGTRLFDEDEVRRLKAEREKNKKK